ncbi:MAG: response regulator [Azonexus sp.]|nr:response regulator [Azonexus sp.]
MFALVYDACVSDCRGSGLRQLQNERDMYIIAYTAHAYPEDRERFLAAGFDDILVKPINRQRLEELIGHL